MLANMVGKKKYGNGKFDFLRVFPVPFRKAGAGSSVCINMHTAHYKERCVCPALEGKKCIIKFDSHIQKQCSKMWTSLQKRE